MDTSSTVDRNELGVLRYTKLSSKDPRGNPRIKYVAKVRAGLAICHSSDGRRGIIHFWEIPGAFKATYDPAGVKIEPRQGGGQVVTYVQPLSEPSAHGFHLFLRRK